jgi:hypothetical protein
VMESLSRTTRMALGLWEVDIDLAHAKGEVVSGAVIRLRKQPWRMKK